MQFLEKWGDVAVLMCTIDVTSTCVLYTLKLGNKNIRRAIEKTVAVVESICDKGVYKCFDVLSVEKCPDMSDIVKMVQNAAPQVWVT